MIDTPKITELEASDTATIHLKIPRQKMPEEFGPAIEELFAALAEQDIEATGPVFAHHFAMEPETFDFEVGVPTAAAVSAAGRMKPGKRPAAKVARTVYHGPYEGLPEAWGEFHEWIENQELEWESDIWEVYVTGPESEDDPAKWRTELNRPLVDS